MNCKLLLYELKDKLKNFKLHDEHILLSLDVKSLFTNIPVELVSDNIDKRVPSIMNKCLIPIDAIKNCIRFLYDNTYFTFNNNVYK